MLGSIRSFAVVGARMTRCWEANRSGCNRIAEGNRAPIICGIETSTDQPQTVNGVKRFLNEIITPVSHAGNEVEGFKLTTSSHSSDFPNSAMSSQMVGRSAKPAIAKLQRMGGRPTGINAKRLSQQVFDFT